MLGDTLTIDGPDGNPHFVEVIGYVLNGPRERWIGIIVGGPLDGQEVEIPYSSPIAR